MCSLHVVICCMALRSAHCGKTFLANAVAGELGVPFISVYALSLVGMSRESEKHYGMHL
ncbi:hypothetical protein F4604DRAFT_1774745, partial [Suillus subluteus]